MIENTLPVLRPMSMGELLDQAFRLYRKNFFTFVGIIAIVYIPLSVISILSSLKIASVTSATALQSNPLLSSSYLSGLGLLLLYFFLNMVFTQGLGTAVLTRAVADNYLGKPAGILSSYKHIGKSWLKLLGAILLAGLIFWAIMVFTIIPCIGTFTGPGLAIFLLSIVLPLVAPVVVIEKTGATASLGRAWELSRRRFWWLVGFVVILSLMSILITIGPGYLARYIVSLIGGNSGNYVARLQLQTIAQQLVTIVMGVLYFPVQLTAITLAYFDLRVRTEGLDMALLTVEASGETGVDATAQVPVMKATKGLLSWIDVGHFAILSIGLIAIYGILIIVIGAIGMAASASAGL